MRWCEHSKISHTFFLNLERHRGKIKTFTKTRKEDGTITEDIQEILQTQREFYKKLSYKADTNIEIQNRFPESLETKLTDHKGDSREELISLEEATKALKEMASNNCRVTMA